MEEAIRVMNEVMAKAVTPADREWFAFFSFWSAGYHGSIFCATDMERWQQKRRNLIWVECGSIWIF